MSPVKKAFSLIEVVLALGLASFALVLLVGLLPVGLQTNKASVEETDGLNLLRRVIADREATPSGKTSAVYGIAPVTDGNGLPVSTEAAGSVYLTSSGELVSAAEKAHYRLDYEILPPSVYDPCRIHFTLACPSIGAERLKLETLALFTRK